MIPETIINSWLLAALGAIGSFVGAAYWYRKTALDVANIARDDRIKELEKQLAVISAAVVPISTAFQAVLIKELTHMHTPRLDALMLKIGPPSTLTEDEEEEMAHLLRERATDMGNLITDSERDAALMLPMVIKRARIEANEPTVISVDSSLQLTLNPSIPRQGD